MTLAEALIAAGAKPLVDDPDAYSLGSRFWRDMRHGQSWEVRQERVLEALIHTIEHPWFLRAADPDDLPAWPRVAPDTAAIPHGLSAWAVLASPGLNQGDWILYAAPTALTLADIPDPFKDPEGLRSWLTRQPLEVLLSSWPDDTDWALFLRPGLSTQSVLGH